MKTRWTYNKHGMLLSLEMMTRKILRGQWIVKRCRSFENKIQLRGLYQSIGQEYLCRSTSERLFILVLLTDGRPVASFILYMANVRDYNYLGSSNAFTLLFSKHWPHSLGTEVDMIVLKNVSVLRFTNVYRIIRNV